MVDFQEFTSFLTFLTLSRIWKTEIKQEDKDKIARMWFGKFFFFFTFSTGLCAFSTIWPIWQGVCINLETKKQIRAHWDTRNLTQ